ncbi:MAG: cytochrome c3 family protein [Candidatus Eisenbacteria bacterium]|nr:NapC/NirT family cytochrome c [Candidatus Eisenbacteria bacterium]
MSSLFRAVRDFFLRTTKHPLGFIGVNLTTLSGVLLLVLLVSSALGFQANPYLGMVTFLILPALFILGLLMIPFGSWLDRRRAARHPEALEAFPVYDLNRPDVRNRLLLIGMLTALNLTILAIASYKGIEYMDSVSFCGATCHPVMRPEYTVYQISPHSRVRCVDCHIGRGASWFVRSKLSGTRQVFKQAFGTWPTPIETPIENLRPSRDTCEQCHWPEKFHGDKVQVITHYQEDSTNTPLKTVLLLKIGGGTPEEGVGRGIHSHIYNRVYYRSDESREKIPWVKVERRDGTSAEYVQGEVPDSIAARPVRLMDCIDCHNRPTHIYRLPARALDLAMDDGSLPNDLPYLKREALAAIGESYPDRETAVNSIRSRLVDFYRTNYPALFEADAKKIETAAAAAAGIWSTYVFPEMKVEWGTYPDHIGHTDFVGCFRCHDEEHVSKDGATISQDCSTCHSLLAMEEENPEVLKTLFP